jgi:hypothetical protein
MSKVINVDFKKKQLEYTWEDQTEEKIKVCGQIHKSFSKILDKIDFIAAEDHEFKNYCTRTLALMYASIEDRV